jgi:hypothetical protein
MKWNLFRPVLIQKILIISTVLPVLTGCATFKSESGSANAPSTGFFGFGSQSLTLSSENTSMLATELFYRNQKIENNYFDIPVEMNRQVEKWIDYFVGRGRDRFERYLERSEYFIPFLKPILKNAKAPEDLVYLAMIESGFNNNARSNARAVGAWQFISATGRRYGLDVNWWVDERRDVEKSTIAAVQYLKELNAMYGSWYLAWASYNAGEAKIGRAIKKYKTTDFWELCKGRYLRPETKNYVPKLIAAAIVSKNRKQFGFDDHYSKVKTVNAALIAEKAEEGELERLPDQLEGDKVAVLDPSDAAIDINKDSPGDAEDEEIVSRDSVETMLLDMSQKVKTPHVNRKGEVNGDILTEVEIPSPADLFKVAQASGLTYMEFKSMNPELLRWVTPPHMEKYKIRIPLSRKEYFTKKYFHSDFNKEVSFLSYKARRGETPRHIARRFGISPEPVAQMNDVQSVSSPFAYGKMIQLPIPSDFVRSLASLKSLDLIDPSYPKRMRYRRSRFRKHKNSSAQYEKMSPKRI